MISDEQYYTSSNFSAVDKQIYEMARRERARSFAYWLLSLKTLFIYLVVICLVIAFMVAILVWAYRMINAPYIEKKTEIVRPEIIEKEVLKVVQVPVEKSILESSDTNYNGPVNQPIISESGNAETPHVKIVTDYHTFQSVTVSQFEEFGFNEVVTGWKYSDSESDYPDFQFCYIMKQKQNKSTSERANLAHIDVNGSYNSLVTNRLALDIGIPQRKLNAILAYCRWASAN